VVADVQLVVAHVFPAVKRAAEGVGSHAADPKSRPEIVTLEPWVTGLFTGATAVTTGASNVMKGLVEPISPDTVRMRLREPPVTGFPPERHTTREAPLHDVVRHTSESRRSAVAVPSVCPKLMPYSVTETDAVKAKFSSGVEVTAGASYVTGFLLPVPTTAATVTAAILSTAGPLAVPWAHKMLVGVVQLTVAQAVPAIPPEAVRSTRPKFKPWSVKLAPPEAGRFDLSPPCRVRTGASKDTQLTKVPTRPAIVTARGSAPEPPENALHWIEVEEYQVVDVHAVEPSRTDGLPANASKFMPATEMGASPVSGRFVAAVEDTAGASKVIRPPADPTIKATVTDTCTPPLGAPTWRPHLDEATGLLKHSTVLELVQAVVPQGTSTRIALAVQSRAVLNSSPEMVTTEPPVFGAFVVEAAEIAGALNVNMLAVVPTMAETVSAK